MDSAQLATRLRLTPMAVRQHLYALQREKLVTADERPVPFGRPAKYWRLTRRPEMGQLALATRQAAADLAQRMRPPQLGEQHGDELVPARKAAGMPLRVRGLDGALKLGPWKKLE